MNRRENIHPTMGTGPILRLCARWAGALRFEYYWRFPDKEQNGWVIVTEEGAWGSAAFNVPAVVGFGLSVLDGADRALGWFGIGKS